MDNDVGPMLTETETDHIKPVEEFCYSNSQIMKKTKLLII